MHEQYKTLPIEDAITSLAIPSEAVSLDEMVDALVAEEEMLKPVKQPLNTALREARIAKGLTQKQLGEMSGINNMTISFFESLKQFPNKKQAAGIAQVLEADKCRLFPPYLQVFVRRGQKRLKEGPEIIPLDEVPENEIEQVIEEVGRTDFYDRDAAEPAMETFLQEAVEDAFKVLTSRQRRIIELRFVVPAYKRRPTLREVGDIFGRTSESIRGNENRALEKLKKDRTLKEFYGKENKDAHEAKEALMNGVVNAIYQKDFPRAQENLAKIEKQEMALVGLDKPGRDKELVEEMRQYTFSYRWSEETMRRFINWSNDSKGHFPIDMEKILNVVTALREVWKLKDQISAKTKV